MARRKRAKGVRGVSGRFQHRKPKKTRGQVPLRVLEERLESLNATVKRRGGDYLD